MDQMGISAQNRVREKNATEHQSHFVPPVLDANVTLPPDNLIDYPNQALLSICPGKHQF